jgi:hypothetical protein
MTDNSILFLYPERVNSIDVLISSIKTSNIGVIDSNIFDTDAITTIVANVDNIQHVGILYENSITSTGFPLYLDNILESIYEKNKSTTIDLLTCNLNKSTHKTFIEDLQRKYTGLTIRYSVDLTGHPSSMGNWIMESHNVSVKSVYFNEMIDQWKHTLNDLFADDNKSDVSLSKYRPYPQDPVEVSADYTTMARSTNEDKVVIYRGRSSWGDDNNAITIPADSDSNETFGDAEIYLSLSNDGNILAVYSKKEKTIHLYEYNTNSIFLF